MTGAPSFAGTLTAPTALPAPGPVDVTTRVGVPLTRANPSARYAAPSSERAAVTVTPSASSRSSRPRVWTLATTNARRTPARVSPATSASNNVVIDRPLVTRDRYQRVR